MADISDLPVPSSRSSTDISDLPAPTRAEQPKEPDLYSRTYKALTEALPEDKGKTRVVGPMLAAGAGELTRGVGAATQLAFPETGKKISDVGRAIVEATKEKYPITGTIGQFGSYLYPYRAAEVGMLKVLPRTGTLGREAQIAGGAGATTAFATQEGSVAERTVNAAIGGILGMGVTYGGALASKGYEYTKNVLKKAYGGDDRRMADALKQYALNRTGAEADAARQMAKEAEQSAIAAERAAGRSERQAERAGKPMAGVTEQEIAGRYRPVGISEQDVGDRIRRYVSETFNRLKKTRSENADKLKGEAFDVARQREQAGEKVADTNAYKRLQETISGALKTPEKLVSAPGSTGSKLQELNNILKGTAVDETTGNVVQNDLSFQGMERLRRLLSDRAYGFPETGFDAIGQQEAGQYAKLIADAMEEFSPGLRKFLDQYKKDSEPLRVFQTKVGKVFEEQLPGATGYAKVASQDIPKKVFANRESYQGLIEALGGNKQLAEAEARKYFANELNKLAGDTKKMEKFIIDNRNMLNLTASRDMAESFLARSSAFARRAVAGEERKAAESEIAKTQSGLIKDFENLQAQVNVATKPNEIAGIHRNFAAKLRQSNQINQQQLETMLKEADRVEQAAKDANEARSIVFRSVLKTLGAGTVGGLALFGLKGL